MKSVNMFLDKAANTISGVVSFFNIFEILDEKLEEQKDNLLYPRNDRKASIADDSSKVSKNSNSEVDKINNKPIRRIKNEKEDSNSEADSESDDSVDSEKTFTPTTISRQSTSDTLEELKENLSKISGKKVDKEALAELKKIMEDKKKLKDPTDKDYQKNVEALKYEVKSSNSLPPSREQSPEQSPISSPRKEENKVEHGSKIFSQKPKKSDKFGSVKRVKQKNKNSDTLSPSKKASLDEEDKVEYGSKIFTLKSKSKVSDKFVNIREVFKHKDKDSDSQPSSKNSSPMHSPREKSKEDESKYSDSKSKISHSKLDESVHNKVIKHKHKHLDSSSQFVQPLTTEEHNKESGNDIKNSKKPAKLTKCKDDYMGSVIYPGAGSKFGQPIKPKIEEEREDTVKFSDIEPNTEPLQPLIMEFYTVEDLKKRATIIDMGTDKKISIESEDEYNDDVFNNDPSEEYNSENLASVIKPMERIDEGSIIGGSEIQHILAGNGSIIVHKAEDIH